MRLSVRRRKSHEKSSDAGVPVIVGRNIRGSA